LSLIIQIIVELIYFKDTILMVKHCSLNVQSLISTGYFIVGVRWH
jgi:hypothetical protein